MRMNAADTSASSAIVDWTPLTVVSRSLTTAEIDTFMIDVSTTNTNIAIASKIASLVLLSLVAVSATVGVAAIWGFSSHPRRDRHTTPGVRAALEALQGANVTRIPPQHHGRWHYRKNRHDFKVIRPRSPCIRTSFVTDSRRSIDRATPPRLRARPPNRSNRRPYGQHIREPPVPL